MATKKVSTFISQPELINVLVFGSSLSFQFAPISENIAPHTLLTSKGIVLNRVLCDKKRGILHSAFITCIWFVREY